MLMSVLGMSAQKSWIFSDEAFLGEASTVEFTEETTIDGLTIVPAPAGTETGKGVVIDGNNKTVDGVTYTHRLKTGGSSTATNRHVHFDVDGPTKITVVLMSGSGKDDRTLNICKDAYDKNNPIGTMPALGATCEKVSYNYTGEAATIFLGSHSSSVSIYAIYTEPLTIYSIVGDFSGGWDNDIDMVESEDDPNVYTLTIENFNVDKDFYEYKLRTNHAWGGYELPASGNNNWQFGTEMYPHGLYNLTFTANLTTNELTLDVESAEIPEDLFVNIAAMKAYEGDAATKRLKLTNAKVTYSKVFVEDYYGSEYVNDNAVIEDESGALLFAQCGLAAAFPAGTILNGTIEFDVSPMWGSLTITPTANTEADIAALETTQGTAEPLLVTEENLDAYAQDFDWRLAKFEKCTFTLEDGENTLNIPVLGNSYGVQDTFGAIEKWPEEGDVVDAVGYIYDFFGGLLQIFQPIEFIPAEEKQVAVITFGNANPGRDYISDPFMVNAVTNLETDLVDGTHMLFNFDSEMNPNGKFWAAGIDGEWNNSAAVTEMNTALNTGFENSDFAAGSPLQASNPGPGDSHANLILTFNEPAKKTLELYVTMTGRNGPLDAVKVTGLDSYNISYAVGDGDGFVSEPTFSQKILGVTLIKIKGYLIDGQPVTVTSLSMAGENSAKCGFQMAGYTFTDEELPFVINSMAIVGTFPGMTWEPTEGIAMTQDPENAALWTVTMEGVTVEGIQYEYKATANGRWGAYELPMEGNQNFVFGTPEYPAGKYNLTFTANLTTNELTLDVVSAETPANLIENIAALKAFEGEDGSYILKLNNALVTYSNTFEDEDYFGDVVTKDYAIIEDETAAYAFSNLGLGAKFAAGTILNGELSLDVSNFFGMGIDLAANEQTPASVEALQTSEGTVEPLLVTEENLDAYAENFDWRQAKFEGVTIRTEEGWPEGVYDYYVTIPVLGNEYGVLDLCGAITEWPAAGEPVTMVGYIFDYFGTQYLQPIEFIPAEEKQVAVITFGNANPGRDYISDPFMVNAVTNLETDLVDGTHMLFNFTSEGNPNGKFWAAGIAGEWNNSAAVAEMNTALNTGFDNSDFAAGSALQATNPGPGDSHANLILTFNEPVKKTLELYVTMTGRNGPLDAVTVTGLDSYNISYAVGDGDGFVSEPTFSQEVLGVTLIKIKGYLIDGQSVTVTSLSMAGENSAKSGFQMAGYTFTDEELPFVINSMAVVGTFPGMTWEPTEGIAMTQDPENAALWTVTMEGVAVEAMQYEYKATANGRWGAYELPMEGNQNFIFGTDQYPAGNYDLTFTADTENHLLTLDVKPSVVTAINAISIDWNDGNTYNLNGQRLTKPVKGIVIRNGRKVVVK